jgi:hypothetical protein
MRQIFTSQRLETVEGVARLLNEAGVQTWTSNSRSYRGRRRSSFSYSANQPGQQPGVWVVRADELVRAREVLRQAGLLETTRDKPGYVATKETPMVVKSPIRTAMRVRLALLVTLTVMAGYTSLRIYGIV